MGSLSSLDLIQLLLGLAVLLGTSRLLGVTASRLRQPAVLGELLAGLVLGPTLVGRVSMPAASFLFPTVGPVALVEDGVRQLAVVLFLLSAGLEVDLEAAWRRGKTVLAVSMAGILVPFSVGYLAGGLVADPQTDSVTFRLFFATALSISALPVIARILMDLGLYRTEVGLSVMGAAVVNDLIGWNVFAVVLSRLPGTGQPPPIAQTMLQTLLLAVTTLTLGRRFVESFLARRIPSSSALLTGLLTFTLLLAALTEFIGIHALFGAFLIGVAFGNAKGISGSVKESVQTLVMSFLAPLYFGGVALKVDFLANFDLRLTLVVLSLAVVGKLLGCSLASRATGLSWRLSWGIGFGMNARGAMEIVLATVALQHGVIGAHLFVSIVVMAWFTSVISGPAMRALVSDVAPPL